MPLRQRCLGLVLLLCLTVVGCSTKVVIYELPPEPEGAAVPLKCPPQEQIGHWVVSNRGGSPISNQKVIRTIACDYQISTDYLTRSTTDPQMIAALSLPSTRESPPPSERKPPSVCAAIGSTFHQIVFIFDYGSPEGRLIKPPMNECGVRPEVTEAYYSATWRKL